MDVSILTDSVKDAGELVESIDKLYKFLKLKDIKLVNKKVDVITAFTKCFFTFEKKI